jgi:hypothetical protein
MSLRAKLLTLSLILITTLGCSLSQQFYPLPSLRSQDVTFDPQQIKGRRGLFGGSPLTIAIPHAELSGRTLSVVIAVANDSDDNGLYTLNADIIDDQRQAYETTCEPEIFLTEIPAGGIKQTTCTATLSPQAKGVRVHVDSPIDADFKAPLP